MKHLALIAGLAWALTACASGASPGLDPGDDPDHGGAVDDPFDVGELPPSLRGSDGHLRLAAANITSGNLQAYQAQGIRILRGIAPDVAMIQELNFQGNTAADLRSFVDQAFGTEFSFVRGAPAQIPNGVVSRYPIIAGGEWIDSQVSNRSFVWAQIDIPGSIDLVAVSVHLLTSSAGVRNTEAQLLRQNILANVPSGAYVAIGGDFNTNSRTESCISTLSSVVTTTGPFPVDQAGDSDTNVSRAKPYDWVLVSGPLHALEAPVGFGSNTFAHGFVADTRVYSPIADLSPALASDSNATSMQHMAVVRDFMLPGAPATSVQVVSPNGGETWAAGSNQTVSWTSTGVGSVKVELTTNGSTFTTLSASAPATGSLNVTAPATATTAARIRVTGLPGGPSDLSDAPFTITTAPPTGTARVAINEILANEPGSDTAGEYVELVNSGTGTADLSGWTISDATAVRHTFPSGTTLAAGRAIVVFAGATAIPGGLTNAVAASTGTLNLANGGDTVTVASPGGTIDSFTYASALAGTDGVSANRSPDGDPAGTFVLHTALSASQRSPGTRVNGAAF